MRTSHVLLCSIMLALTGFGRAQTTYSLTDLGTLGGSKSAPYSINNAGTVTGEAWLSNTVSHLFRTSPSGMVDLDSMNNPESVGLGINNSGHVAGWFLDGSFTERACWYNGSSMLELASVGANAHANAINDSDQIVGWYLVSGKNRAYLLTGPVLTTLPTLGGNYGYGYAINNAGLIGGMSTTSGDAVGHAFIYDGAIHDIGTLGFANSLVTAINTAGVATGYAYNRQTDNAYEAFTCDVSGMHDIGAGRARGINSRGDVVLTDNANHGVVYTGGVRQDLTSALDSTGAGWQVHSAEAINDSGVIVGVGIHNGDTINYRAIALTPHYGITPTSFSVPRGTQVSGGLQSLQQSDNQKLLINSVVVSFLSDYPVQVIVDATSPITAPSQLKIKFEASANSSPISQTIDLYDYTASRSVTVDVRSATTSDQIVEVVANNPARFVEAVTGHIEARIRFRQSGSTPTLIWAVGIDQAIWTITP